MNIRAEDVRGLETGGRSMSINTAYKGRPIMLRSCWLVGLVIGGILALGGGHADGQDWPQWRGPNRDAKASGFKAPATWPKELTKKWSVTIGNGVATPSLADGKLIVFSRQDDNEIVRCLNAATGDELWKDEYPAKAPTGGAGNFPGPRSSPTVSDDTVVTLGVQGTLTCYGLNSGRQLWRKEGKEDFNGSLPMFFPSSSPIVVDGVCIAQLGGEKEGGIVAFDLTSGEEKWRWTGDSPAYGSPALMTVGGKNVVIAPTLKKMVALGTDGKQLWEIPYSQGGRYNSASPIVSGNTLIMAGPGSGFTALKLELQDGELKEEKVWNSTDNSVQFSTPVLKDGVLYGVSNGGQLFCINTETNKTWAVPISKPAAEEESEGRERAAGWDGERVRVRFAQLVQQQEEERPRREGEGEGRGRGEGFRRGEGRGGFGGRGGGRGRRGGGGGYGSVVDAGQVLLALSPAAELVIFQPTDAEYKEVARYKVAEGGTYAYPVPAGNGIYIKDQDAVTLWTVE